jgi:hypothetical protein
MQFSSWRQRALPPVTAIILALVVPLALPLAVSAQDDGITAPPSYSNANNSDDQNSDDQNDAASPATAGVARIDAINGDVAIQRGDASDTLAAVPNAPVLAADYVTTGQSGRAEVGFDGRSAVRLGENVQIRFTNVDPSDRQMQLAAGTIDLRLFGDTDGQSSIDTPSVSVVPRTAGSFRVSVDANGETAVTVRNGRADIVTPQGTQSLEPGTTLIADGAAANPQIQTQPAIALDGFDSYNGERDRIYVAATSASQYVNTNIQGVGDLAANGHWVADGTYGNVWIPTTVAAGWAPYRDGNWVWEDGFGWTWVAAEPWGWAPYHYGRWYFSTAYHNWAWYPPAPGRFAPAWSPALVGFVGFNIGAVSVGIGFGNIGWVPLAPFEAFHPWWGPHARSIVNNTTIINNNVHYRNLTVNNAMTSVTRENFQAGRFGNPYVVSREELRTIRTVPVQGALPIVPSQANLRFTQRAAAPSLAARPGFMNRTFAGRQAFAPQRTPFNVQQQSVSRATHVAFGAEAGSLRSNDPWQRFGTNRGVNGTAGVPAYQRPAGGTAPYSTYTRPSAPAATYSRPSAPAGSYVRPAYAQPQYNRQSAPEYNRQATPAYNRGTTPAYNRPATSTYTRPATAHPAPAARATHSNEEHHDR